MDFVDRQRRRGRLRRLPERNARRSNGQYELRSLWPSCSDSYTFAVDAYDKAGNRSSVRSIAASTTRCSPPNSTVAPSISGTPREGQTLTAGVGSWTGDPTSYAYQWLRCDALGTACSAISVRWEGRTSPWRRTLGEPCECALNCLERGWVVVGHVRTYGAGFESRFHLPWPASYFTGPLGMNNILPATRDGALVGLFHTVPGGTIQEHKAAIAAREAYAGRRFDVYTTFLKGAGTYNGIPNCAYTNGLEMVRGRTIAVVSRSSPGPPDAAPRARFCATSTKGARTRVSGLSPISWARIPSDHASSAARVRSGLLRHERRRSLGLPEQRERAALH